MKDMLDRKYCSANNFIINNTNFYPVPLPTSNRQVFYRDSYC